MRRSVGLIFAVYLFLPAQVALAIEPVTLATVVAPSRNTSEEPVAKEFTLENTVHFLDSASLQWQKQRKCCTCHTNFAYLYARGYLNDDAQAHEEVRGFVEQLVNERWKEKGPRWDAEVVAAAAALAYDDSTTKQTLQPTTRKALDRMWTLQRPDGGWDWLKCDWPPMEIDDHYGATLAAIAVGVAPDEYHKTAEASRGMKTLRTYFKQNPPSNLHHAAMLLWASTLHDGLMSDEEQKACVSRLSKLQKEDGGWGFATLGDWERQDGKAQDLKSSDGYGTGFVLFVLRKAGVAVDDPRVVRGIQWLKKNQRESGRWFTRSVFADNKHFISHAGTAFALMALGECGELD